MKVYVKLDMEGISGVVSPHQVEPGTSDYDRARRLMMHDLVSVLKGAFSAGATEIMIYDMHADGRNISLDALNGRVSVIAGRPPPREGFFYGLDDSYGALFLVGCHARAGAAAAVLPHTYEDDILKMTVNGTEIGEIGIEAALAGEFGIPLAFVSTDSGGVSETQDLLGDDVEVVEVKKAVDATGAICLSAQATARILREAASRAVRRATSVPLVVFPAPVSLEVTFDDAASAAQLEGQPGIERTGETAICSEGQSILAAYRHFVVARGNSNGR